MRGKGKGRHPSDQIHMPRVIKAAGQIEDEAKGRAKVEPSSDDE